MESASRATTGGVVMLHLLAAAIFFLSGCAPTTQRAPIDPARLAQEEEKQREVVLRSSIEDSKRLFAVARPLLMAGVGICENTGGSIGMALSHKDALPDGMRPTALRVFGIDEYPRAFSVLPGGPAAKVRIGDGDRIQAIGGHKIQEYSSLSMFGRIGFAKEVMEMFWEGLDKYAGSSIALVVERNGADMEVVVPVDTVCPYGVDLDESDIVNAYADGKTVKVTRGMMRFATDQELAVVVAHEIAHNAMKHMDAKTGNALLGGVLDVLVAATTGVNTQGQFSKLGGLMFSPDFEAEADYVGLYILARTGLPFEEAPNFWRKMAAAHPASIGNRTLVATHPPTPERFVALEQAVAEIKKKQASGEKLIPNMR